MDIFKAFGINIQKLVVDGRDYTTKQLRRRAAMTPGSKPKAKWEQAAKESHQEDRAAKREELGERAATFERGRTPRQAPRQLELPIDDAPQPGTLPSGRGLPSRRRNVPAASPSREDYPTAKPTRGGQFGVPHYVSDEENANYKRYRAKHLRNADRMARKKALADEKNIPATVNPKYDSEKDYLIAEEGYTEDQSTKDYPFGLSIYRAKASKEAAVPIDEGGMPQPYDPSSDIRGESGDYPSRRPSRRKGIQSLYDPTTEAHYPGMPDPRGDIADKRATRKHGVGISPPSVMDKALFKMFGIKKAHKEVPQDIPEFFEQYDIPEFISHPEIPGATIRNPEYTKYKHGGATPPGEVPVGEGITVQERGSHQILPDTFTPEKEGKKPYVARRAR